MLVSMSPESPNRPRVGIPWRSSEEEASGSRSKTQNYEDAVRKAGGDPVLLPLRDTNELQRRLAALDGFVLPGNSADLEPRTYNALDKGVSEPPDYPREETDRAILEHAFREKKPVLAICYGCQLLNVYLEGSLIQDIHTQIKTDVRHRRADPPKSEADPIHDARLEPGSRLLSLSGEVRARINSSHHQSVEKPGKNLRVTAHAPDGVIEGVEWTGDSTWVVGVQWHPERMVGDAFAERLFGDFVAAAQKAREAVAHKA